MIRFILVPCLFVISCLSAGIYGGIHNQISYTVSPEYFTEFKFEQFRISPSNSGRIGAAIVGWEASWWMGIVIGVVLIPFGLLIRSPKHYFWTMLGVFAVVALTTLATGLIALLMGFVLLDSQSVGEVSRYGSEIIDDAAFVRAGNMHHFSYLGGLLGIFTGGAFLYRRILLSLQPESNSV